MKMMGLRNSVFWMSWVVTYLINFALVCALVIGFSKGSLFKYSDGGLLFLFFFSFCLSLISLACLVTTFFSRAKTAGTLSPFMLLASYLPYMGVSSADTSESMKNLACLLSPVALSLGSTEIIAYEGVFIGSQWDNAGVAVDNFKVITAIAMMLFDAILYGALAWYLDKIWPREYGTHLKWYFIFTPSYWRGFFSCCPRDGSNKASRLGSGAHGINAEADISSSYGAPLLANEVINDDVDFGPDYEAVPESMRDKAGVKIRGLRKQFNRDGNEVTAVNGIDLNLYEGQCFVLLGHNGAGSE